MIIGVLREARPRETRVAATPATVTRLVRLGYEVVVDGRHLESAGTHVPHPHDHDGSDRAGHRRRASSRPRRPSSRRAASLSVSARGPSSSWGRIC
ncbi:hypothetical protein ACFVH4_24810 [Nocardia ignorata]|uniref:hypothetical protein n=1 Tax=Nocardia ignorata TaxID=145285 RepID=UPI00363DC90F